MSRVILSSILLVFILYNAQALTDEQKNKVRVKFIEFGTECIFEHPLSIHDIKSLRNKQFPDDESAGCFVACVFKKAGLFDDTGKLSPSKTLARAGKIFEDEGDLKNIEELLTTCAKVNEEDDGDKGCGRARPAFDCLIANSEQFGFNINF